jgi:hypothetical protein
MMSVDETDRWLAALRHLLDQARLQRRVLTYLDAADGIDLPPPKRIHRVTRLLERLIREDAGNGRPILAALVVSRVRQGLPAPGFFDLLVRLDRADPEAEPASVHAELLRELFGEQDSR